MAGHREVHPDHSELVDEVIDWYDGVTVGIERTVMPQAADEFALKRWAAHGYETDPASLGDTGSWTQLNVRTPTTWNSRCCRTDSASAPPTRPGRRPRSRPMWTPGLRHPIQPRATRASGGHRRIAATCTSWWRRRTERWPHRIMWLDEANRTAEFEPVGTHPDYRRLGLGRAMLLHGMHLAREAGAHHMTVACLGAPGHPQARGLYYSVGFREFTRDVPLIKTGDQVVSRKCVR
ncbi:GNAT family N-acetyltransferase [Streptomyces sp. NPDC002405]|uniref:GNAT family N-acetyltransferase n=1 Tax=Streptomyces sp. NPDC057596 TaxID=3346178 RepID=UPI0036AA5AC0